MKDFRQTMFEQIDELDLENAQLERVQIFQQIVDVANSVGIDVIAEILDSNMTAKEVFKLINRQLRR